jgi:CheY-like chemotaxis protein
LQSEAESPPRPRILVVDDDRMLADTLREMILDQTAADVEIVTSGLRAAAILESGPPFDLVICDLGMPGVDGIELYRRLQERKSPMADRLVLVTGGAFTDGAAAFLATAPVPCLQKPFSLKQLGGMLRLFLPSHTHKR